MNVLPGKATASLRDPAPPEDVAGQMTPGPGRRPRSLRWIVLAGTAVALSAALSAAVLLTHLHRRTMADAERELTNLSLVLANYTENTFRSVELLQAGLVEMIEALGLQSTEQFNEALATQAVNQDLRARILALPQIEALFLTNAEGQTIASTRAWPQPVFSIADRPHFRMLRDNPGLRSYLAPPAQNVQTGTWNIYLTRRLTTPEGRFLGIVGVGLSLTQFEEFLGRIALGQDGSISLWRRDGILMARWPQVPESIGRPTPNGQLTFPQILADRDSGTARGTSTVDGQERLITARTLDGYPVVVTVTRSVAEILRLWRRQAGYTIVGACLLVTMVIGAVLLSLRQLRNQEILDQTRTELRILAEQRRSEAQITHLAHHDSLTGLANRILLRTRLDEAVARAQRGDACAVLCLDLDHFKDVNDTLGHPVGDRLLQVVTARILAEVRDQDTVARLGGDEFAIVQTGVRHPRGAAMLAQRLVETLGTPFDLDGHHVIVGVSIGIAIAPEDGPDPDQLLRNADMALYRAKAAGRGAFRFFEAEMNDDAQLRRSLQLDLRRAIEAEEFELFYQPQVRLKTRRISGFEALLRWRHPERGLVMPERFIPLAEETGLIIPLGEWALRQACTLAAGWPGREKVAVNLSPVQFASLRLVPAVAEALAQSGLDPARLELEITETVMLRDTTATLATLHRLKALGVSIALDDFGTGYSSLSYLQRFPFDKVKIDKSFVKNLAETRTSGAIVRAIVSLCTALEMTTTAEGVETEAQYLSLAALGCTEAQGYLFSQPCPASDLAYIAQRF
jgi:diguanylate cyclase (GGDEF)-like protein